MVSRRIGDRMLDLLSDESKWIKGGYVSSHQSFCIMGAYGQLTRKNPFFTDYQDTRSTYLYRMLRVVREQFPDRVGGVVEDLYSHGFYDIGDVIASFNDHLFTTYADVRLVLEKARG